MNALLQFDRVSVDRQRGRRRVRVVHEVSFALEAGGRLGLVGESGSGKTTLARVAAGLLRPSDGHVRVNGLDPADRAGAQRRTLARTVQMVFQDPTGSLQPRQTLGGALDEALAFHGHRRGPERRARVEALLAEVGLDAALAARYPHEVSGGQRQRAALARALAPNPALLIADEPVSALDVSVQVQILNLLLDLQARRGLALLFIAHDLAVVRYTCERVMVLREGRVVEEGACEVVLAAPSAEYTRALLAAVPTLPDPLEDVK